MILLLLEKCKRLFCCNYYENNTYICYGKKLLRKCCCFVSKNETFLLKWFSVYITFLVPRVYQISWVWHKQMITVFQISKCKCEIVYHSVRCASRSGFRGCINHTLPTMGSIYFSQTVQPVKHTVQPAEASNHKEGVA